MSKSNSTNKSLRKDAPLSVSTPAPLPPDKSSSHSGSVKKTPDLKSKSNKPNVTVIEESDGYELRNYPEYEKAEREEDIEDEKAAKKFLEQRFEVWDAEMTKKNEKKRAREALKKTNLESKMLNPSGSQVARSESTLKVKKVSPEKTDISSSTSGEPRVHERTRSSTVSRTLRGGLQRLVRASMNTADFGVASLGELASARWIPVGTVKQDADGFPLLESIPPAIKKALCLEYRNFTSRGKSTQLNAGNTEKELKLFMAKKFLSIALSGEDSDFDQSRIGSLAAVNSYLSKKFGFKIEAPGLAESDEPVSSRSSQPDIDFVDLLVQDAVSRSRHYTVTLSVDLGEEMKDDYHTKTTFADTIGAAMKGEKVTKTEGQRSDVSATFVRDFPHSVYEMILDDGSIKKIKSIDEFVAFIGDPQKKGVPLQVSYFASQNLGVFIKNLVFSKTDSAGRPQTFIKLYDGTPVAISMTPKASYRFKKTSDGSVEMQYQSLAETRVTGPDGRAAARIWVNNAGIGQWNSVVIENASAKVECRIVIHPDATVTMGALQYQAEGWNHID